MSNKVVGFCLLLSFFISLLNCKAQFYSKQVSAGSSQLSDIFMINPSIGYVGGVDGIYKTTDGGQTWKLLSYFISTYQSPDSIFYTTMNDHHLHFVNENVGYSVGWGAMGNYEQIIRTNDGGATWQLQHMINPDTSPFQPVEMRLRDIHVFDINTAISVGYRGRILKTSNGSNWAVQNSGTDKNLETVHFFSSSKGIAAGDGIVLFTNDGGESWSQRTIEGTITDIRFLTETEILAITEAGNILKSYDGGMNWTVNPFRHGSALRKMFCLSLSDVYVAGDGVLLRSTDGGEHFDRYEMSPNDLTAVHVLSGMLIYLPTTRGRVIKTDGTVTPKFNPISIFKEDENDFCFSQNRTINFTNYGRNDYQYKWYVGDQLISQTFNFSYKFPGSGYYQVKLSVTTSSGTDISYRSISIRPEPVFSKTPMVFLEPGKIDTLELNVPVKINIRNLQDDAYYYIMRNGVRVTDRLMANWGNDYRLTFNLPAMGKGEYTYTVVSELGNSCDTVFQEHAVKSLVLDVPIQPNGLRTSYLTGNRVYLTWSDRSKQEISYVIERRAEGEATFKVIGERPADFRNEYTDSEALQNDKMYYYRVTGKNAQGLSIPSPVAQIFIHGAIMYVNPEAVGNNNGASWEHAITDIGKAFREATADEEIWVAKGTYYADINNTWTLQGGKLYGGFIGNEHARDQRDWKKNKTILSGDAGVKGVTDDNADYVLVLNGAECAASGFTVTQGKRYGVSGSGLIEDCIVENNAVGIYSKTLTVSRCVARNNKTGIKVNTYEGTVTAKNTIIYNNSEYGLDASERNSNSVNCLFYANKTASFIARYFSANSGSNVFFNTIFGNRSGDGPSFDPHSKFMGAYHSTSKYIQYDLTYIAGDDNILGNDDDLFYFPEPDFINRGSVKNHDWPHTDLFTNADKDLLGNGRIQYDTIDMGMVEYTTDTIRVPAVTVVKKTPSSISIAWEKVTNAGTTRLWLERKSTYFKASYDEKTTYIPLDVNAESYVDSNIDIQQYHSYCLRIQKGEKVSYPGRRSAKISTWPMLDVSGEAIDARSIRLEYVNDYPVTVTGIWLERSIGSPDNFKTVGMLAPNNMGTYLDVNCTPETTYYYRFMVQFKELGIGWYSAEIVMITTPVFINTPPVITGQKTATFEEGQFLDMSMTLITVKDDYTSNCTLEVLPGDHYVASGLRVTPSAGATSPLFINIRISDGELHSDVYPFAVTIMENKNPVITGQSDVTIAQGSTYQLLGQAITASDDRYFPNGMLLDVGIGSNYTVGMENSIVPSEDFYGELLVNVRVSDGVKFSEWYPFVITVLKKEVITAVETDPLNGMTVYPNPAHGAIFIESTRAIRALSIIDSYGREIVPGELTRISGDVLKITLPPGYYTLKAEISNQVIARKLVVL